MPLLAITVRFSSWPLDYPAVLSLALTEPCQTQPSQLFRSPSGALQEPSC